MFKRVFVALVLFAVAIPALAAPPTPMMWRAVGEQGTVYLLGSFHLLKAEDYPLADAVEQAYDRADKVLFEVPPESMKSPDFVRMFMAAGMLPKGEKLSEKVSPETRAALVAYLGSEAALPAVDPYRPWFFGLNIALTTMQAAGFDPTKGLDHYFMARVAADGKPTGGLESVEDQLAALAGAPWEEQEISLRESLKPKAELTADIDRLHTAWRTGNVEAIEALLVDEMQANTPVTARLVNLDRNQRWVPQIRELLAQPGTTLVIVGALHLVGDDGVPSLLEAEGQAVKRVAGP